MRTRRGLGSAVVGAGVVGALALAGAPAQAALVEHDVYHDTSVTSSAADPNWPCKALGFAVTITTDVHGNFRLGPRKPGGPNYGADSTKGSVAFSANGSTYTGVFSVR